LQRLTRPLATLALLLTACNSGHNDDGGGSTDGDDDEASPFAALSTETLTMGPATLLVWIADTPATQANGLMDAVERDLDPLPDGTLRGMLFVFPTTRVLSFWMRDTEVALDLAYLDESGRVIEVHSLVPLDETLVPSSVPVRYALELRAGTLQAEGLGVGDTLELP